MMMKLLIANDDGINANGLQNLVAALAPHHTVYVAAPTQQQSAMGHSLSLHSPVRVAQATLPHPVEAAFAISGTPADCVKLALTTLLPNLGVTVDCVLSGINHGPNLGGDIVYSGTVAAGLEGAILGVPAMALSLYNGHEPQANFEQGAQWLAQHLEALLALPVQPHTLLNINFPSLWQASTPAPPLSLCTLGRRMYVDYYEQRKDPRGDSYYWLAGDLLKNDLDEASDVSRIGQGHITLTPLCTDMTQGHVMNSLALHSDGNSLFNPAQ
jgi:5'-nucleotidase